jgi:hypothetical protein
MICIEERVDDGPPAIEKSSVSALLGEFAKR